MTGLADVTRRLVARDGQAITLRRIATGQAPVDLSCTAVVRDYRPHELVGSLDQGDRQVIITNDEIVAAAWPGPPRRNDRVVMDAGVFTVQAVNTAQLGATIIRHTMTVRG